MSLSWLDAMFGRIFSKGVSLDLRPAINFAGGLKATSNEVDNRIEVSVDSDIGVPITNVPDSADGSTYALDVNVTDIMDAVVVTTGVATATFVAPATPFKTSRIALLIEISEDGEDAIYFYDMAVYVDHNVVPCIVRHSSELTPAGGQAGTPHDVTIALTPDGQDVDVTVTNNEAYSVAVRVAWAATVGKAPVSS